MRSLFSIVLCVAAAPCLAQSAVPREEVVFIPSLNTQTTVSAGGELFSHAHTFSVDGAVLTSAADWGSGIFRTEVSAGTKLVPVTTKVKYKACSMIEGTFQAGSPCFLDDDGDSVFDRIAYDETAAAGRLKRPVSYSLMPISIVREDAFRRVILYQGATADSIRFSYREFRNDLARPAFTEELVIPRETFPQMIAIKNLEVEVLGLNGMGMSYKILKIK